MSLTHLKTGAQKKTVFGPAAWFQSGMSLFGTIGVAVLISKEYNFEAIFDNNPANLSDDCLI